MLPWNTYFHRTDTFCITLWEKIRKAVENLWFQESVLYPISWQRYPNSTKSQTNKSNSSPVFSFSTSLSNRRGEIGAFWTVCSCCPFSAEHLAAYRIMMYSWEMWGPTNHLTLALVRYRLYERWINEAWRRNWAHKKYRRQSWKQREEEKHTRF